MDSPQPPKPVPITLKRHHRRVNLRRNSQATVAGLQPTDKVTAVYDPAAGWRLEIESEDGVEIKHVRLTNTPSKA